MSRVLVLDVIGRKGLYEAECEKLDDFYRELKCDCFDITTRNVNGVTFDIFCDDVGLFIDNPTPSALDENMQVALVGNLVFAHHDREGNTTGLSDSDIEHIRNCATMVTDVTNVIKGSWEVIYPVTYT